MNVSFMFYLFDHFPFMFAKIRTIDITFCWTDGRLDTLAVRPKVGQDEYC